MVGTGLTTEQYPPTHSPTRVTYVSLIVRETAYGSSAALVQADEGTASSGSVRLDSTVEKL